MRVLRFLERESLSAGKFFMSRMIGILSLHTFCSLLLRDLTLIALYL